MIVPVIYLTNRALIAEKNVKGLADRIRRLVNEISKDHFGFIHYEIQLDCDWNEQSRRNYFQLIDYLNATYKVTVTIRLHQIKFPEKTGVPPVDEGVLMAYNVGDLGNFEQNSILEADIVGQYIHEKSNYPLELHLALPLYSQTVIKNNDGKLRLINGVFRKELEAASRHFEKINKHLFEVKKDTLYKGFYLYKGYQLKLEELEEKEILKTYSIIKNSELYTKETIFYHLDERVLEKINFDQLIKKFN